MSISLDSLKGIEEKPTPVIPRVSPRVIPGVLSNANKGAIDWGWQSFVSYGCNNHVIVIDTQNVKVFQTLEKHVGDVIKVKWANENYYHDLSHPYNFKLASADSTGLIVVWDVKEGKALTSFQEPGKPASEIEWLSGRDSCQHLLVGLHPPYSMIIWNTESGTKLWKKSYTETLSLFAFDPFSENNVTFLASDCILFVDDFNIQKTPSSNGRKFYISNPSSLSGSLHSSNSGSSASEERSKRNTLTKRVRLLVKADSKSSGEGVTLNECLNLTYHRSYRHHLLLLYAREILILDLEINQTVGIVSVEHTSSPMSQLYSCWQRDVLYVLHDSGSVSFRLRHRGQALMVAATPSDCSDTGVNASEASLEVMYDLQCQSDALRLTKHAKVIGMAVCASGENKISLLVSDGRVLFLEMAVFRKEQLSSCVPPYLASVLGSSTFNKLQSEETSFLPLPCTTVYPATTLGDYIGPALYWSDRTIPKIQRNVQFKMFISGNLNALAAPPHVIRMCPPVTFRNWTMYKPYMAIGNNSGSIQIINMATGVIEKEYSLHTSPVRGIEWVGLTSFLSYSHPNITNSTGHVRNEVVLTDLQSGRTKSLRGDRSEESPIDMIRVSYSRQYIIIAFKEEPFEIWDLRQLILLRVMPKNFPSISALEWSPGHYKRQQSSLDFSFTKIDKNAVESPSESESSLKTISYTKEHFVFTDTNGQLYHFSVEGNIVKNGSVFPADIMGSVTCIAWKGEYIVLGDVDGNLNICHLKEKHSKGISTQKKKIKKIRFGPGKGNMKILVLYNDGVDMWDVKELKFVNQVRCPKELPKVQDIDWVSSDRPVLATGDGCIRITDTTLKLYSSPVHEYQPSDVPFAPHLLSPEVSLYSKSFLQHILWKHKFNSDIDQQNDSDMILAEEQLQCLDDQLKSFLKTCPYGTAERCLHVSRAFGDQEGCIFWTVALHFLKKAKTLLSDSKSETEENEKTKTMINNADLFFDQPLDTGYDVLCDNETYKKLQLDRVRLHVGKRTTYAQTQQCAERLLLLGQMDQAVQLLLETEAENESFYEDCLRACLIATVQSSGTSQSIIKLVSTNLIASGHILEGVQLLCLIEKSVDACRYLQGAGRWNEAVWLAKATLPEKESQEILKRWTDYLCSNQVNQKSKAILILLSMQNFWRVVELLHSYHMTERAALFLQACLEFGLITKNLENGMLDAVFKEYSKYLSSIKNRTSAIHYCTIGSDIGDDLGKQFQFVTSDDS